MDLLAPRSLPGWSPDRGAGKGNEVVPVEFTLCRPATRSEGGDPPADHTVAPDAEGRHGLGTTAWPSNLSTNTSTPTSPSLEVMADQADLVEIVSYELRQLANLWGTSKSRTEKAQVAREQHTGIHIPHHRAAQQCAQFTTH